MITQTNVHNNKTLAKKEKPTKGSMWLDGYLYLYNLPFPVLLVKRMVLIKKGYFRNRIRIGCNK